jgi:hypothetical protein
MRYTVKDRVKKSLKLSKSNVFLRQDFDRFGGYEQVGKVLKELLDEGAVVRVGYGVYVKSMKSVITGNPVPLAELTEIGLVLMKKLGVKADVGAAAREYRDGKTTQIPVRPVIAIKKPTTRKIAWGKKVLAYEKY